MKSLIALSLAAALLSGCTAIMPSRDAAGLKIASWNLEHLAERDGEGCSPRTEVNYAELRRHAEALDADVVAFQEVQSQAAAERVFDPAIYDVVMSTRPPSTRSGECRGRPGLFGDWNRRLASRNDAFLTDLNDGDPQGSTLTLASGDRPAGCKARYREFIDFIATGAGATARVQPGLFEEYLYGGAPEAEHPSDHCPITVRIGR
ncbi:endonuclease/exonuclease/phosphatase family protein [Brevundimonas sp.]|uniref:endonuclease/exonuclease/phosphatase family protein n=1 Tax=Brevundimonas sp. TaxID=1871086 RepID=UPI00289D7892|nr:endonuclease/exonuclease/phosphatase family protein [Brevundimonas sp.]